MRTLDACKHCGELFWDHSAINDQCPRFHWTARGTKHFIDFASPTRFEEGI